jgi:hypothetical protein
MHPPLAVSKFFNGFHQGGFLLEPPMQGAVRHALLFVTDHQRTVVVDFLRDLLDGSRSAAEIRGVWDTLPKGIRIDDDAHVVEFSRLTMELLSSTR